MLYTLKLLFGAIAILSTFSQGSARLLRRQNNLFRREFDENGYHGTYSPCEGVQSANFNLTGSFPNSMIVGGDWTYHTGLSGNARGNATQEFWIDSEKKDNLNAANFSSDGCLQIYYDLPIELYAKTGPGKTCNDILGKECMDALRAAVGDGTDTYQTCNDPFRYEIPEQCAPLKDASPRAFSVTPGRPSAQGSFPANATCSTQNNANGNSSHFLTLTHKANNSEADFANYDTMAQKVYVILEHFWIETRDHGNGSASTGQFATSASCLWNEDVVEGSREPDALKNKQDQPEEPKQDEPENSVAATGVDGWAWGLLFFMAAFVAMS
ncbi:hypothetical protein CC78DRAFT_549120 [Lojkania enalia]|uniref:Uncharacterized protein n=1 Tax=Lojkania enalia TaxID=147567 RepID=A0A9P4JWX1_9PLEO|nr:hypothetical protein CC78DRAFT_549120 [Didymosphaeria enalia]